MPSPVVMPAMNVVIEMGRYLRQAADSGAAPSSAAKRDFIIGVPFPVFLIFGGEPIGFRVPPRGPRRWGQPCAKGGAEPVDRALNKRLKESPISLRTSLWINPG